VIYAVPLALALWAEHLRSAPFLPPRVAPILGALLLGLGCIGFGGIWVFLRAGTSPNPYRPSTALVTTGPYRFTRNPMYLGFTLLYLGVTCWVNSLWPLLALPLILLLMQRSVIAKEEAYLEHRFGEDYRQYRMRVRRWL
jgi:protein-S-isoprenylcysteine O-methyltransferase Ste14